MKIPVQKLATYTYKSPTVLEYWQELNLEVGAKMPL
jgi:hypothetical protein